MSRIRVRHVTGYRYEGGADTSYNEARMLPASGGGLFVLLSHLEVTPNTSTHSYTDYWGTRVTAFEILGRHSELSLTASSLVEVGPRPDADTPSVDWETIARARQRSVGLVEQSVQTALTAPPEEVAALAAAARERGGGVAQTANEILGAIYDAVEYEAGVTGVRTTAKEAWAQRRGVCQDITHIALGALRAAGIPAQYISGYFHPRPKAALGETVSGESHAWLEYWDGAWRGWDVTNNSPVGERHVRIGRGRDYNDVPPLRGVYAGSGASELFVRVEITREA